MVNQGWGTSHLNSPPAHPLGAPVLTNSSIPRDTLSPQPAHNCPPGDIDSLLFSNPAASLWWFEINHVGFHSESQQIRQAKCSPLPRPLPRGGLTPSTSPDPFPTIRNQTKHPVINNGQKPDYHCKNIPKKWRLWWRSESYFGRSVGNDVKLAMSFVLPSDWVHVHMVPARLSKGRRENHHLLMHVAKVKWQNGCTALNCVIPGI